MRFDLVVDTGMHQKHGTRQQAIDYFLANVATTECDATSEVDRYISWPVQARAYKIGELKIKELRERVTKELGTSFNLRKFHAASHCFGQADERLDRGQEQFRSAPSRSTLKLENSFVGAWPSALK